MEGCNYEHRMRLLGNIAHRSPVPASFPTPTKSSSAYIRTYPKHTTLKLQVSERAQTENRENGYADISIDKFTTGLRLPCFF